jgi:D-alanyl-D-alanine carboxypeptidase
MPVRRMPFQSDFDTFAWVASAVPRRIRLALVLVPALFLAACGQQGGYGYNGAANGELGPAGVGAVPQRYYPPPGPPGDPWGPYIHEAAVRYGVPEQWIRAVMQQESGGEEQAVSPVGAMGLMQIMPETYEGLQERYGFGNDPFDPHNNILAGTAYIREMYDLFGSPGFLAAYNAGPDRVDAYLTRSSRLPVETVNYLAAVAPNLGNAVPPSGPLAVYASAGASARFGGGASIASLAAGCDLDAAYDPNHPCSSLEEAAVTAAPPQRVAAAPAPDLRVAAVAAPPQQIPVRQEAAVCDENAAYDPAHPCRSSEPTAPRIELASAEDCDPDAAYDPERPCRMPFGPAGGAAARLGTEPVAGEVERSRYRAAPRHLPVVAARDWAIQVGAYTSPALARAVAEGARHQAPKQLRYAALTLPPTPYRHGVLYRARLAHLSAQAAAAACSHLNRRQLPCIVVRPSRT